MTSVLPFLSLMFAFRSRGDVRPGGRRRPELAAAEEAGVPARGAPRVPRARRGGHVHAAQPEAQLVGEEELEHVQERPHEVAPRVRPVPARTATIEFSPSLFFFRKEEEEKEWGNGEHV